ncbi:hypothetical protein SLEP1_g60452 [Rubroshorea leprosula]|uniref:Uncharacterized protein n=1 Tax=Rubroshorea leprosula TaxID=152421 RepID=A0AAV5MZ33_9ROSI|nr:hypothetical protein SLEP1_g60452 [Rubroshorea leprosula]
MWILGNPVKIEGQQAYWHCKDRVAKPKGAPTSQVNLSTFDEDSIGKSRYVKLTSKHTGRPDLVSAQIVVTGGCMLKGA